MMNKDELKDLFQEPLAELDEFAKEIQKIKNLINLIIENFDLLKDDITDDQIGDVSSEINVKVSKVIALIKDIMTDSKKLEAFIHQIKLLKRKRDKKLGKSAKENELDSEIIKRLLESLKTPISPIKINPYTPYTPPYPDTNKKPPTKPWEINF